MHHIHTQTGKPDASGWFTCKKCGKKYRDKPWMNAMTYILVIAMLIGTELIVPRLSSVIPNRLAASALALIPMLALCILAERAIRLLLPTYEEQDAESRKE